MSIRDVIPEKLIPSKLDLSDPFQKEIYDCHADKYRFAALFVKDRRVLNVACGAGYGSSILYREGKAASVLGVDIDEDIINYAKREYGGEGISFVCAGFDEIGDVEGFGAIVSINTLEYLSDPWRFLRHLRGLLSEKGELVISTHITPVTDFNPFVRHDFSRGKFHRLLRRAGFQICHEFLQIRHFRPGEALGLMRTKKTESDKSTGPRALLPYYLAHPVKALRRLRSLLTHGMSIKTLTVQAKSESEI